MSGGGIGTFDIVATNQPGVFALSKATVTFGAPEPSTAALFALALILGALSLRIRARGVTKLG